MARDAALVRLQKRAAMNWFYKYWPSVRLAAVLLITVAIVIGHLYDQADDRKSVQCCSANECATQHHHDAHKDSIYPRMTNKQLNMWYADANEQFFLDQLPKDTLVEWGDLTAIRDMGLTSKRADGTFSILLDRGTNTNFRVARLTEFHEICHVKTWAQEFDDHGIKFRACMLQLAEEGAFEGLW